MIESLASAHPFLVHFAVALSITGAGFDCAGLLFPRETLERTGLILTILAVPFLLLAAVTGNLASSGITEAPARDLLHHHETAANLAIWTFVATANMRLFLHLRRRFIGWKRYAYGFAVLIAASLVFVAARWGGELDKRPAQGWHRSLEYQRVACSFMSTKSPYIHQIQ